METHQQQQNVHRLHQAHYFSLRARMLLKEKEMKILKYITNCDYAAVVQEKEQYLVCSKSLLESLDILKAEYVRLTEEERDSSLGQTLLRVLLEFENIELTLNF